MIVQRPPWDFRERFRRVFNEALVCTRISLYEFRELFDYDGFLDEVAPLCADERELVLYFLANFLPSAKGHFADVICVAVVQYLGQAAGRREPDEGDKLAIRALSDLALHDEQQLKNWLKAYFP